MTEAEEFIRENSSSNVIDNRQVSSPVTSNKIDIRSSAAGAREKMKQKSLNVNTAFAKNDSKFV